MDCIKSFADHKTRKSMVFGAESFKYESLGISWNIVNQIKLCIVKINDWMKTTVHLLDALTRGISILQSLISRSRIE